MTTTLKTAVNLDTAFTGFTVAARAMMEGGKIAVAYGVGVRAVALLTGAKLNGQNVKAADIDKAMSDSLKEIFGGDTSQYYDIKRAIKLASVHYNTGGEKSLAATLVGAAKDERELATGLATQFVADGMASVKAMIEKLATPTEAADKKPKKVQPTKATAESIVAALNANPETCGKVLTGILQAMPEADRSALAIAIIRSLVTIGLIDDVSKACVDHAKEATADKDDAKAARVTSRRNRKSEPAQAAA